MTAPVTVLNWLLDSDPAIRWQALRDLADASARSSAERARVATEGWGTRLLALQGEDRQWAGGALFPARRTQSQNREQLEQGLMRSALLEQIMGSGFS